MDSQCFRGKKITVIEGTSTLADDNFSTSATATERVFDNTEHFFTNAKAVLSCSFTVAPTDQTTVDLYIFEENIFSTNGVAGPGATDVQGATLVGQFKLYDTTAQQYQTDVINMFGVREAKFSIKNTGGQTMDADFVVTLEGLSLYGK